jgi:hypothetical protein
MTCTTSGLIDTCKVAVQVVLPTDQEKAELQARDDRLDLITQRLNALPAPK